MSNVIPFLRLSFIKIRQSPAGFEIVVVYDEKHDAVLWVGTSHSEAVEEAPIFAEDLDGLGIRDRAVSR